MSNTDENITTIDSTETATKKKKVLPILAVVVVALCIGLGGFYYYNSTPKKIVSNVINKAYKNYDKIMNEGMDLDVTKDAFRVKGNLVVDTNIDGFENLKNDKIGFDLGLDYKGKKAEIGANLVEKSTTLADVMAYLINDKLYLSLGDDYKDLIAMDNEEYEFDKFINLDGFDSAKFNKEDINFIVKAYKDILIDSIDSDDLEKSSDKIEVDGKETSVTKITYKLDSKRLEKLSKNIIEGTLNNDELLSKLAKMTDTDKKELKENLKESKKNISVPESTKLTLNIYTKGFANSFVGLDLKSDEFTMNIVENKDVTNIKLVAEGFEFNLDVKEYSSEKIDMSFVIKAGGEKVSGSFIVNDKEVNKNTHKGDMKIEVKYNDYKVSIKLDYTIEKAAKVADVNTKKAVSQDEAEDDMEEVMNKIQKRLEKSEIYEIIEGVSEMVIPTTTKANTSYNYNTYDYDYEY